MKMVGIQTLCSGFKILVVGNLAPYPVEAAHLIEIFVKVEITCAHHRVFHRCLHLQCVARHVYYSSGVCNVDAVGKDLPKHFALGCVGRNRVAQFHRHAGICQNCLIDV